MGKKWADISKSLGSRTENSVKNRWNSLIKKYRIEFGIEGDQAAAQALLRKSNNYTIDDIEKKISLMIIESKDREFHSEGDKALIKKIEESNIKMNEDDSSSDTINEKVEEEKSEKIKILNDKKKLRKNADVDKSKNVLKDLVQQERENAATMSLNSSQPVNNFNSNFSSNPINMNALNQINSMKYFPFSNPFNISNLGNIQQIPNKSSVNQQNINATQQNLINSGPPPTSLPSSVNLQNINPFGNLFGLNDMLNLNILFLNSNNPLNTMLKPNLFQNMPNVEKNPQVNMNINPQQASANKSSGTSSTLSDEKKAINMENIEENEPKEEGISSRTSFHNENDERNQFITLKTVPFADLKINEVAINNNQLMYAIVDVVTKQLSFVAAVDKENAPTIQQQGLATQQSKTSSSLGGLSLGNLGFQPSPIFSPHRPNLFSSPLVLYNNSHITGMGHNNAPIKSMNKEFTNLHISKSFESSPDISNNTSLGNKQKENMRSNEWTPEIEHKQIFANLNAKDHLHNSFDIQIGTSDSGNLFGKSGNSAFRRQVQIQALAGKEELIRSMGLGNIDLEKLKSIENNIALNRVKTTDSPSKFLNSSNPHHLT